MKSAARTILFATLLTAASAFAGDDAKSIALPKPKTEGGMPLMQALAERRTGREFSSEKLPLQTLSDMLWAAAGINRPDSGRRTSPTAKNCQEIDVYVAMAEGVYLYDPKENKLAPVVAGDIRALTGKQAFIKDAPVNLIFVADLAKMGNCQPKEQEFYAATDTGYVSQNVYLYCASAGLATVVRGYVDREPLAKAMKLRPEQRIILAQTVGYPKKKADAEKTAPAETAKKEGSSK